MRAILSLLPALALCGCQLNFQIGDPPDAGPDPFPLGHRSLDTAASHGPANPGLRESRDKPRVARGASRPVQELDPTSSTPNVTPDPPAAVEPEPSAPPALGPVVLRLFPQGDVTPDPFGRRRPPAGVQIMHTERRGHHTTSTLDRGPVDGQRGETWIGRTAHLRPRQGESLEHAIARVRPWFDRLPVADEERFLFDLPRTRGRTGVDRSDATLVRDAPVEIHRAYIHEVAITDHQGEAFGLRVCWSRLGQARVPGLTRPLVGQHVAYVVDGGVLWAPRLGGEMGDPGRGTLVFLHGDRAFGERLRRALSVGHDEVTTEPASPFPCGR